MMRRNLSAFKIEQNGKIYDYRLGQNLDLKSLAAFFGKKYRVKKLWQGARHVLGFLEKSQKAYFLKVATTEGISILTKKEYDWNEKFNREVGRKNLIFTVPLNYDSGYYQNNFFYLITDRFLGERLVNYPQTNESRLLSSNLDKVIDFSELIQNLKTDPRENYQAEFLCKTKLWYEDIPSNIISSYEIKSLLDLVSVGVKNLSPKVRHGDFTPWHIFALKNNRLGLFDGEHFNSCGVEYYDISYFVQRVFGVLKNPDLAKIILNRLLEKNYSRKNLKTVLASRAIGGFLDESLTIKPDYNLAVKFKDLCLKM